MHMILLSNTQDSQSGRKHLYGEIDQVPLSTPTYKRNFTNKWMGRPGVSALKLSAFLSNYVMQCVCRKNGLYVEKMIHIYIRITYMSFSRIVLVSFSYKLANLCMHSETTQTSKQLLLFLYCNASCSIFGYHSALHFVPFSALILCSTKHCHWQRSVNFVQV